MNHAQILKNPSPAIAGAQSETSTPRPEGEIRLALLLQEQGLDLSAGVPPLGQMHLISNAVRAAKNTCYDDTLCQLRDLADMLEGNAALAPIREAIASIVQADERLQAILATLNRI